MLKTGTKAPDFKLKNQDGEELSLSDLISDGSIVLYFYPKNETYGCIKEACAFRDQYEDFTAAGASVVGISMDSVGSHQRFVNNRRLPFTLLSDPDGKVHKAYESEPSLFGVLRQRNTYVIDKEGVIRMAFTARLNFEKHVEEALRVVGTLS